MSGPRRPRVLDPANRTGRQLTLATLTWLLEELSPLLPPLRGGGSRLPLGLITLWVEDSDFEST